MMTQAIIIANKAWFTLVADGRRSIVFSWDKQNILQANDHQQWASPILTTNVNQALGLCSLTYLNPFYRQTDRRRCFAQKLISELKTSKRL